MTDLPDGAEIGYSIGIGSSPEEADDGPYVDDAVTVSFRRYSMQPLG